MESCCILDRKDFNMVQGPTDTNFADIHTKPLGGQGIRFLVTLFGYWRMEGQTKVGELERKAYEETKNIAGQVNKVAMVIVRIVILRACSQWLQKQIHS